MSGETLARSAARDATAGETRTDAGRRRAQLRRRMPAILVGLALSGGLGWYVQHWWRVGRFFETTDDAYVGGNVTTLSPQVPGFVARVLVADNQFVRAGQRLIELDPRAYEAQLARAVAVVRRADATLASLAARRALQRSLVRQAEADLAARQAEAAFARVDAQRYRILARAAAGSQQSDERAAATNAKAQAEVIASQAALAAAKQQLAVLGTEIAQAEASLAEARAEQRTARLDLSYTTVRAPMDGYVGDRTAQVGAYATAGTALLSIVPAHGLWIDANFKEDELARMRPGQPATIATDILPDRVFKGRVASLAPASGAVFSVIPAQNATGNFTKIVQRVPVRIALDGTGATLGLLRPGLSATVTVDTSPDLKARR